MLYRIKFFLQKYKKPILIGLAIILILLIIIFAIPWKKKEAPEPKTAIRGAELAEQPTIVKGTLTKEDQAKSSASVVAKSFAEIYGSYSNQSNYANIEKSLPLLSSAYKATMSAFLKKSRATYAPGAQYKGVSTLVINTKVESLDETSGKAMILLKTQKKESVGAQANYVIKYQDIRLNLVKEGGNWVVDSANWL